MPNYGHTTQGINIANYRLVAQATSKKGQHSYRSPAEWQQETKDHVGLGNTESKQSSTLRYTSHLLQAAAADQVLADVSSVETALRNKIQQTQSLKGQLEGSLTDVESEIAACVALRLQLEERLHKVQSKLDLNQSRLQVRDARPSREKTMDDVEKVLLKQQTLVVAFIEKVKRAINHLDREVQQLEGVKTKLVADLKDKAEAIEVDSEVLSIREDGSPGGSGEALMRKKHDCLVKTPHTWVRSTEENLHLARHWLTDSARLRKAIRHAIYNARTSEHEASGSLNSAMMVKLSTTHKLKDDIEAQLAKVRDEAARAAAQRTSLAAALEAKRGPLAQAKERYALRRARPCRESVQDDVEAALSREIAHLNAVTSQLSDKVTAVDKELENLELAAAMLEDNLKDKEAALALDERCVLLDGRINITTPPPSSVASYPNTSVSTARSATLKRIALLEGELVTARREREALEASISHLKTSLNLGK